MTRLPTPPQAKVLQAMAGGAVLYRYENPNHASWSLHSVPPINATMLVHAAVATATRCAGWVAVDGAPENLRSGRRQRWALTDAGCFILAELARRQDNAA